MITDLSLGLSAPGGINNRTVDFTLRLRENADSPLAPWVERGGATVTGNAANPWNRPLKSPIVIPPKSDFVVRAQTDDGGTFARVSMDIVHA